MHDHRETMVLRNLIIRILLAVLPFASMAMALGQTVRVSSAKAFESAMQKVTAGDTIAWSKGRYEDVQLELSCDSILFTAETPGETIFSGTSFIKVTGRGNTIAGFQFLDGKIEGDILDIYGNGNRIVEINFRSYESHYYLRIRPDCQYNVVSNCNFEAKPESQESSVVQIEATEGLPGYHLVTHCSFRNHTAPPGAGGDFGIEALRIGYSYQRHMISRTIVEYCYFEKCNGDYEVISCKARENVMRYNTFINNGPAHLTLRHASRNTVYGNFFINGAGVRVKEGQNHSIVNNYFDTGDQFAIHLQNHHFDPVDTVIIANNTFIGGGKILLGGTGDYPPGNVTFANNLFSGIVDDVLADATVKEQWIGNVAGQMGNTLEKAGFHIVPFKFSTNAFGFEEPEFPQSIAGGSEIAMPLMFDIPVLDDDHSVRFDIMKQERTGHTGQFPGCFLPMDDISLKLYVTSENTGPYYLR